VDNLTTPGPTRVSSPISPWYARDWSQISCERAPDKFTIKSREGNARLVSRYGVSLSQPFPLSPNFFPRPPPFRSNDDDDELDLENS